MDLFKLCYRNVISYGCVQPLGQVISGAGRDCDVDILNKVRLSVNSRSSAAVLLETTKDIRRSLRRLPDRPRLLVQGVYHQRGVLSAAYLSLCHHHVQVPSNHNASSAAAAAAAANHSVRMFVSFPVYRVYKAVIQAVQKSEEGHPFK